MTAMDNASLSQGTTIRQHHPDISALCYPRWYYRHRRRTIPIPFGTPFQFPAPSSPRPRSRSPSSSRSLAYPRSRSRSRSSFRSDSASSSDDSTTIPRCVASITPAIAAEDPKNAKVRLRTHYPAPFFSGHRHRWTGHWSEPSSKSR